MQRAYSPGPSSEGDAGGGRESNPYSRHRPRMRPFTGDSHTDDDKGSNSAPDHGNGFRQLTELTKPRSRSHRLTRSGLVSNSQRYRDCNLDQQITISVSSLTNPTMSALRTPTREAPRHTARPPTAKDSTPEGGTSTTQHQGPSGAALPDNWGTA